MKKLKQIARKVVGLRKAGTDSHVPKIVWVMLGVVIVGVLGGGIFYITSSGKDKMQTNSNNAFNSAGNTSSYSTSGNTTVTGGTISSGN